MNSFGHDFRITLFGESHGEAVGVVIDGVPAGIALAAEDFESDLARRRSGAKGTTPRRESDTPHILSGVFEGHTTGAPLAIIFENGDTRSADYTALADHWRPSHADRTADVRFGGWQDVRGGGHFSARLTVAIVAAGVVAKKILPHEITFTTRLTEIGGESNPEKFNDIIARAASEGDSVGGIVECCVEGCAAGLGDPMFDSVESLAAHLLFSVPAVKGVEFGRGFGVAQMRGSGNNDTITDCGGHTSTNNDGGINGGITNGNPIIVRAALKPTPSIARQQMTYNRATDSVEPLTVHGRHDACVALRGAVVIESAMAIALADLWRRPQAAISRKR